jgi:predicted MFS family arabinose efflux permease
MPPRHPYLIAFGLSLGAAIALGLARFSYGLLLLPMRADLGWSYLLAGAMNTANAAGYLLGALLAPALLRRYGPRRAFTGGALLTGVFMLLSGLVADTAFLFVQRVLAGAASAAIFVAGGLLVARLGALHGRRIGLLLGIYYGGTGLGIVLSALLVPALLEAERARAHGWQIAWLALGAACLLLTLAMHAAARRIPEPQAQQGARTAFPAARFTFGLAGYFSFGMGYIGYMTFVVALLRQQGMPPARINLFFMLLGAGVIASSFLWARLLDRYKGGQAMAMLNGLLGVATLLPVLTASTPAVFASGLLFGCVFLSVVGSSTALVRHNLPAAAWPAGIGAFTTVFAFGQIVGPSVAGWIADGPGGLAAGFVFSAATLFAGMLLAWRQRAL